MVLPPPGELLSLFARVVFFPWPSLADKPGVLRSSWPPKVRLLSPIPSLPQSIHQ